MGRGAAETQGTGVAPQDLTPCEAVGGERKLEPAELFHQVLEHRWYRSEREGRDVGLDEAVQSYVEEMLSGVQTDRLVLPLAGERP